MVPTSISLFTEMVPPIRVTKFFRDRHAKTGAAKLLAGGCAFLLKGDEQPIQKLPVHANPCVAYRKPQPHASPLPLQLPDFQADGTARRCKFQRIGKEVQKNLVQPQRVADQHRPGQVHQRDGEGQAFSTAWGK